MNYKGEQIHIKAINGVLVNTTEVRKNPRMCYLLCIVFENSSQLFVKIVFII